MYDLLLKLVNVLSIFAICCGVVGIALSMYGIPAEVISYKKMLRYLSTTDLEDKYKAITIDDSRGVCKYNIKILSYFLVFSVVSIAVGIFFKGLW